MRGAVSLAVALALPLGTNASQPSAQPHHLHHIHRDPLHPRRPRAVLPALVRRLGIRDRDADTDQDTPRAPARDQSRTKPNRQPRGRGLDPRRLRRTAIRHLRIPQTPPRRPRRQDRGRPRLRRPLARLAADAPVPARGALNAPPRDRPELPGPRLKRTVAHRPRPGSAPQRRSLHGDLPPLPTSSAYAGRPRPRCPRDRASTTRSTDPHPFAYSPYQPHLHW
jgi:hypothetical protein